MLEICFSLLYNWPNLYNLKNWKKKWIKRFTSAANFLPTGLTTWIGLSRVFGSNFGAEKRSFRSGKNPSVVESLMEEQNSFWNCPSNREKFSDDFWLFFSTDSATLSMSTSSSLSILKSRFQNQLHIHYRVNNSSTDFLTLVDNLT